MDAPLFGGESKSTIERRRRLAEILMSQATDSSPVGHWTGALARGVQGIASGFVGAQADKADSERRKAMVEALMGASPEDIERMAIETGDDELMDMAGNAYRRADRDAEKAWRESRAETQDSQWQQSFAADEAYRNRPPEPKRYEVGNNLVDESGGVVYQGEPKPTRLTESEIKGGAIKQGVEHAVEVLTKDATPDNPIPGLDELSSWGNTIGNQTSSIGGGALMSEGGQVTLDALNILAQHYIYALSGQTAPEQEVQRTVQALMPGITDKPERVQQKKQQIVNMIKTIEARAAPQGGGQPQMDMGGVAPPPPPDQLQPGMVVDGHIFMGGDPADPASWEAQ